MTRKPNPENLAKLSPEQREVWDKWEAENEASNKIIEIALAALANNNQMLADKMFEQLDRLIPYECEHGHSIYNSCIACEEIEKIVYPEYYNNDGTRMSDDLIYKTFLQPRSDKNIN